ncbi:hypothetical protein AN477_11295 [Alicyclobacillus ferrooxydans]|uniref:Uncharacterized protein n=1 Tax=Alicyclobacillus ferrooxydans TaxID=471514 RepID=A0A0P9EWV5_9BACL|nr:hypothetical protein AN477_11295 [Alicyclobacillus ferrooxydans]
MSLGATRQFRSPYTNDSAVSCPSLSKSSTARRTTPTGTWSISASSERLKRVVKVTFLPV